MKRRIPNFNLERIYRINVADEWSEPLPGRNDNGEQLLMGVLPNAWDIMLVIYFSSNGMYLRHELLPIQGIVDPTSSISIRDQQRHNIRPAVAFFKQVLGIIPGSIAIHHFAFPEWHIGIAEWPSGTFEYVRNHMEATGLLPDDEFVRDWSTNQQWVLWWGGEFWMSEDGEITDT